MPQSSSRNQNYNNDAWTCVGAGGGDVLIVEETRTIVISGILLSSHHLIVFGLIFVEMEKAGGVSMRSGH